MAHVVLDGPSGGGVPGVGVLSNSLRPAPDDAGLGDLSYGEPLVVRW